MEFSEIERNLDLNQHIGEDIKDIVYETYYDIYTYLGKEGFLKWVDRERLTIGIRNIIFQALTEKQDPYLKENSTVVGYHIGPRGTYNKENIVLRKGVGDNKDTNSHEAFHSLVNGYGGFNAFFGEGLTEFLKKTMYGRSTYSYQKNVETVYLAYSMFGNIILKDYFQNKGDKFFFHLSKGADGDRFQKMMETGKRINTNFAKYHNIINNSKKPKASEFKKADLALKNGISDLLNFYYMKKQVDIERFKHIKNDKIDFNKFIDEQANILKYLKILDTNRKEYKGIYEQFDCIRKQLIEKMVRNSHLIFNKSEEEQQEIINKVTEDVSSRIFSRVSGKYLSIEETYINQNTEEPYKSLNENATGKLVVTFLYKDDCSDFLRTIRRIADIQSATTEFSTEDVPGTLKVISKNLDNKNAIAILGNAQTFAKTIENISELERQYEYDLEIPSFIKIEIDELENLNTYVEFNDKEQFLVFIDTQEGKLDRISLSDYNSKSSEFRIFTSKDSLIDSSDRISCSIFFPELQRKSNIIINPKTQDVELEDGKVDTRLMVGMKSIYEDVLNSVTFKVIDDDIHKGSYSHGMSKEQEVISTVRINKNPRSMDIDDFVQDYIDTKKIIPGLDRQEETFEELSEKLIDTTFESHVIPKGTTFEDAYKRVRSIMVIDMKKLLDEKQKEKPLNIENLHKRLNDCTTTLNNILDNAVEKSKAGVLVNREDREEDRNEFLKQAVLGTKRKARTEAIKIQMNQIELLKRGLPMKTKEEEMRDEHGDI